MNDPIQTIKDAILSLSITEGFRLQAEMGMQDHEFIAMLHSLNRPDITRHTYQFAPMQYALDANGVKKIMAIKIYREMFNGSTLKLTKETVEGLPFEATEQQVEDLRKAVKDCGYSVSRIV